jgi:hypothetical protein
MKINNKNANLILCNNIRKKANSSLNKINFRSSGHFNGQETI